MSKRKNTLNDLEEFLKLQASTLVPPQPVEPSKSVVQPKTVEPEQEEEVRGPQVSQPVSAQVVDLLGEMKKMAVQNKAEFYDYIIKAAEAMPSGSNDVLLINTALYLKHGDNWKAGIEEYWTKRKSSLI